MSENQPPAAWPPNRSRKRPLAPETPARDNTNSSTAHITTPARPPLSQPTLSPRTPLTDTANKKLRQYRNGYEVKPQTPSYKPYALPNTGRKRQHAFAFSETSPLAPISPLSGEQWHQLAHGARLLPDGCSLRDFQTQCANIVLQRTRDVCVIAPTGQGKSLLWVLPLLAQTRSCSLVITPYTNLGLEGQERNLAFGLPTIFVHAEQKAPHLLEEIAAGTHRIVFACPEMLESPVFARILHSTSFQYLLSGIYVDEAHLAHESASWRPAYTRIHQLRQIIGYDIPIIAISATLPSLYRQSLQTYVGLREGYSLINLGNYRPELSTVVMYMEHEQSSFKDLTFLLQPGMNLQDIKKTLVYCDNLELLTAMFWWFQRRLAELGLPTTLVDILHAGLTPEHQEKCLADFKDGRTMFLLASEKLGAGMNFFGVDYIVQYLVRRLTLVRWSQRHGRGARMPGTTALGILLVEPKMKKGQGLSPEAPMAEDPGLLDLVQSERCCRDILDQHLENPPRPAPLTPDSHLCCSRCHPSLIPKRTYEWIMEARVADKEVVPRRVKEAEKKEIHARLKAWRLQHWREEWREQWPSYGPESLVSDADLDKITKSATSIADADDLYPLVHITHWSKLSAPLLEAVRSATLSVIGEVAASTPVNLEASLGIPGTSSLASEAVVEQDETRVETRGDPSPKVGKLQPWEQVIRF